MQIDTSRLREVYKSQSLIQVHLVHDNTTKEGGIRIRIINNPGVSASRHDKDLIEACSTTSLMPMTLRAIRGRGLARPGELFGVVVNSRRPRSVDRNPGLRRRRLSIGLAEVID